MTHHEDIRSIYGTSQEKSESFHSQNQSIFNEKCVPAINRYTGVVYENIGWEDLSKKAQEYLQNHVMIFSGLFGMVRPLTPIPNYKLKMNVLSLQHHWKPVLTEALSKEEFIIDLLPQVHRKAYNPNQNEDFNNDYLDEIISAVIKEDIFIAQKVAERILLIDPNNQEAKIVKMVNSFNNKRNYEIKEQIGHTNSGFVECFFYVGKIKNPGNLHVNVHEYVGFYDPKDILNLRLFDGDADIVKKLITKID